MSTQTTVLEKRQAEIDEMKRNKPKYLCEQGYDPEEYDSLVDYFNTEEVGRFCNVDCKGCVYHYLNNKGGELTKLDTPLCGTWG